MIIRNKDNKIERKWWNQNINKWKNKMIKDNDKERRI